MQWIGPYEVGLLAVEESSLGLKLVATVDVRKTSSVPPASSLFASREELDAVIIDHDDAFGHSPDRAAGAYILTIERDPWNYQFVQPSDMYFSYFQEGEPFDENNSTLDSVVYVRNVVYRWRPLHFEARYKGE